MILFLIGLTITLSVLGYGFYQLAYKGGKRHLGGNPIKSGSMTTWNT